MSLLEAARDGKWGRGRVNVAVIQQEGKRRRQKRAVLTGKQSTGRKQSQREEGKKARACASVEKGGGSGAGGEAKDGAGGLPPPTSRLDSPATPLSAAFPLFFLLSQAGRTRRNCEGACRPSQHGTQGGSATLVLRTAAHPPSTHHSTGRRALQSANRRHRVNTERKKNTALVRARTRVVLRRAFDPMAALLLSASASLACGCGTAAPVVCGGLKMARAHRLRHYHSRDPAR